MKQDRNYQRTKPVNGTASQCLRTGLAMLIAACCFMLGCTRPEQPVYEKPPSTELAKAPEPAQPQQMPDLAPPKLDEVKDTVKRVFKDVAFIDKGHETSFFAGDFNGDLSQDIAVVVKPGFAKLNEMNQEYPSWVLRDPFVPIEPGMERLRVEATDTLLAIIHGNGPNGWRDPEATQTYLLKNAVGSDMKIQQGKEFVATNRGKKIPRIHGDLIGEVLKGTPGYLYYSGPTYSWYSPKTFTGEAERIVGHGKPKTGM